MTELNSQKTNGSEAEALAVVKQAMRPVRSVPRLLTRGVRCVHKASGFISAFVYAYSEAIRIDAFNTPNPPELPVVTKDVAQRMLAKMDIALRVHGEVPTRHALWVSNHISWLDPLVFATHVPATFIGKAEIAGWPLVGKLVRAAGTVFIKRGSGDSGSVSEQIAQALTRGASVMFFPEATTTNGRYVHRIHGKLLTAALIANTPVQPMVILYQGADGSLDRVIPCCGDDSFVSNLLAISAHTGVVAHIKALAPISPVGHDRESLTLLLKQRMDEGFNALHREVFGRDAARD